MDHYCSVSSKLHGSILEKLFVFYVPRLVLLYGSDIFLWPCCMQKSSQSFFNLRMSKVILKISWKMSMQQFGSQHW